MAYNNPPTDQHPKNRAFPEYFWTGRNWEIWRSAIDCPDGSTLTSHPGPDGRSETVATLDGREDVATTVATTDGRDDGFTAGKPTPRRETASLKREITLWNWGWNLYTTKG